MTTRAFRTLPVALLLGAAALGAAAPGTAAQERAGAPPEKHEAKTPGVLSLLPGDAVTEHAIDTPAGRLAYTATAGTFPLFDQSGERTAAIFYTAYVAKSGDKSVDPATRPVTFVFNGGPGASAAYLHLGLVGPRIAEFGRDNRDGSDVRLKDNPETWLAFTDLVLIDPVGAGWSRPAKPDGGSAFWGVRRDAQAMAKAIALYVNKNVRSASPKYILGESYGGFRAVKVARALQQEQGIFTAGVLLFSPMLEGAFQFGGDRFALGAALHLPSLAAAELERRGAFSPEALAEAERFAMTDYLTTLAGPPPKGEKARAFYARVAELTGLPVEVVTNARGFIRDSYVKKLRAKDGKIVSRYDAAFAVADPYPDRDGAHGPDPVLDGVTRAYSGAFASYARNELGFKTDMTYVLLASDIAGRWDWQEGSGRNPPSASDDLRSMLSLNPSFRVLVAHGYTDMVTPYGVSRYVLDHLPEVGNAGRTQLRLYRGGHMFYLDTESRRAFTRDAKAFYQPP